MSLSVLARAARQQGRRRLAALHQAAPDAQLLPQPQQGAPWQAAQHAQYCVSLASCSSSGFSPSALFGRHSCGLAPAAAAALHPHSHLHPQAAQPWRQLQLRGFALGSGQWRSRRKDVMPDRNLPQKNEQIRAPEVRLRALRCTPLFSSACCRCEPVLRTSSPLHARWLSTRIWQEEYA